MSYLVAYFPKLKEIILIVVLCIIVISFNQILTIAVIGLSLLITWNLDFWKLSNHHHWLVLVISSYLLITSDIGEEIRLVINIVNILLLAYFFFSKYEINISSLPKLPKVLVLLIILTMCSMVLSTIYSINFYESLTEIFRQIIFFIIIYFFYCLLNSERELKYFYSSILLSATILSIIIIFTFLNSDRLVYFLMTEGFVIDAGYMNNQTAAGGLFAVSIPLSFATIFSTEIFEIKFTKYMIILIMIQLVGLLLTNSRAAIFATLLSSLIILFILRKKIFLGLLKSFIIFSSIVVLIFPPVIDIISSFFRLSRVLENTRYYIWDMAFELIKQHPIIGVGPGQFYNYMYNNLPVLLGSWEEKQLRWLYDLIGSGFGIGHNFLIQRVTELGFLGLIPSLYLPTLFLTIGVTLINKSKNLRNYPIIVGIVSSGVGLFFRSFYEATGILSYGWITRDLPFWLMLLFLLLFQKLSVAKSEITVNQPNVL